MPPLPSARAPSVPPEKLIATLRDLALEATERGQAAAARELGLMADRMQAELDATRPDSPTA
jgi:hypothetical protein